MTSRVEVPAPAKVNLFLRVLDRRPDGFHDIETLFQAVDFCDDVTVTAAPDGVELCVDGTAPGPTEDNLAVRAARAFLDLVDRPTGVKIQLTKRIPAGGGLGGGSSDAAAVLRGLAALAAKAPPVEELRSIAESLGSDVPFFLCGSPLAVGRGRGERLDALDPLPARSVVLVVPPVHVATDRAYHALSTRRGAGFDPVAHERRLPRATTWDTVVAAAHNDFETVVPILHPDVDQALAALGRAGGRPALLSGSGGACFGLFPDRVAARRAAEALTAELGWPVVETRTLVALPDIRRVEL